MKWIEWRYFAVGFAANGWRTDRVLAVRTGRCWKACWPWVVLALLISAAGLQGAAIGAASYLAVLHVTLLALAYRKTGFYAGAVPLPLAVGRRMHARVQ